MFPDHRRQLKQLVAVQSPIAGTLDAYGKPTLATPVQYAARVEREIAQFNNANGTMQDTDWLVITESEIKFTDRVWLPPDGDNLNALLLSKSYAPQKVFKRVNVDGTTSHFEVYL